MTRRFEYGEGYDGFGNERTPRPWKPDSERSGFQWSAPPLGRWSSIWMEHGYDRKRIVDIAIEEAEDNLKIWQNAPDEGFANMNLDIAYERLGDILNWLYVRKP